MYTYSPNELKSVQSSIMLSDGHSINVRFEHFLPQSERNPYGRIAAFNIEKTFSIFSCQSICNTQYNISTDQEIICSASQSIYYNKHIYLINKSNQIVLTLIIRKGSFIKEGFTVITFPETKIQTISCIKVSRCRKWNAY